MCFPATPLSLLIEKGVDEGWGVVTGDTLDPNKKLGFFFFLIFPTVAPFLEREPSKSGVDIQQRRNRVKETERRSGFQRRTNYQEWSYHYCRRCRRRRRRCRR